MLNFLANVARRPDAGPLFGQDCLLCGDSGRSVVCGACEPRFPEDVEPQAVAGCDRIVAPYAYVFPVDRLVKRFKFGGDLALGAWLASRIADRARREPRPDLLVPMPLAAVRLRERGFNQAKELARNVGRQLGIPLAPGATRIRATAPQPGLDRAGRRRNLRGAFRVDGDVRACRVAIVDDVLTSGATAESLAQALRAAGVSQVDVWVVARTPGPGA